MSSKQIKTKTELGLGKGPALPQLQKELESKEMQRVRESFRALHAQSPAEEPAEASTPSGESVPPSQATGVRPRLRESLRRDEPSNEGPPSNAPPPPSYGPLSRPTRSWGSEPPTGQRRKRTSRPPVVVDDVGATAMKIARRTRHNTAPRLLASRAVIARAPLDSRAAFILSLVDGRTPPDALVDMSGMPAEEVTAILGRLTRLGLVALS